MAREVMRMMHLVLPVSADAVQPARWRPSADVYRTRRGWLVKFDLAGVRPSDITMAVQGQSLVVRGAEVTLAPKEYALLQALMENRGRVLTRQTLLDKVWGYDFEGEQQTVSVHIRWLREKIEEDSRTPRHILTVRSRGYMFRE